MIERSHLTADPFVTQLRKGKLMRRRPSTLFIILTVIMLITFIVGLIIIFTAVSNQRSAGLEWTRMAAIVSPILGAL
jgi:flagellar basal body-associated protein FliL